MTLVDDKYLFFTKDYLQIFNSLDRYFRYLFNKNILLIQQAEIIKQASLLLILREERDNPQLLNIVTQTNIDVITLGFDNDNDSSVNLIDFANFKENFSKVLTQGKTYFNELFSEEELKEKLKNFFHSHGEDSLFEHLNWSYYFLSNGPEQFIKSEITYDEYRKDFLSPGLKNWERFKSRFYKYRDIIKLSNYKATLNELESAINEADSYVTKLSGLTGQNLIEEKSNFFKENVEKFKRIDDILSAFYRKLSFAVSPLQNTIGG